jgi:hypothetical protein
MCREIPDAPFSHLQAFAFEQFALQAGNGFA